MATRLSGFVILPRMTAARMLISGLSFLSISKAA